MNILIFVVTMIMILSMMTYARLESYRNSQAFQVIFKHYMQEDERGYINLRAKNNYDAIKVGTKKGGKGGKKVDASARIGIGLLFDSNRDSKDKEWNQTKVMLKNLIKKLYENQPFYIKIEGERPGFIDELIQSMVRAIDDLPKDIKPKKPKDLANLRLEDPLLNDVLYKVLRGAAYMTILTDEEKRDVQKNISLSPQKEGDVEVSEDEEEASEEQEDFKSPPGYYSLLDFVTDRSKPIRVYLAPKEVLQSIFQDPATVQAVIEERERLFKQANNDADVAQLSESFKEQFLKMKDQSLDDKALDFSVNKTNPKNYR